MGAEEYGFQRDDDSGLHVPIRQRRIVPGVDIERQYRHRLEDADSELQAADIQIDELEEKYRHAVTMAMALVIGIATQEDGGDKRVRSVRKGNTFEVSVATSLFEEALQGMTVGDFTALLHSYDDRIVFQVKPMEDFREVKRKERQ